MFNNLLSEKEYECYNVVTAAEEGRGALLIGDFNSATSEEVLKMHSIKTVITAAMGLEHLQIPSFVEHIVYPLQDAKTENIKSYFDESFLTIDKSTELLMLRSQRRRSARTLCCRNFEGMISLI
jgi:hypothetical protein